MLQFSQSMMRRSVQVFWMGVICIVYVYHFQDTFHDNHLSEKNTKQELTSTIVC